MSDLDHARIDRDMPDPSGVILLGRGQCVCAPLTASLSSLLSDLGRCL